MPRTSPRPSRAKGYYATNKTPEYQAWRSMRGRCLNPKHHAFKNYGGRGITICKRWGQFENFLADMGNRPDGFELDRADPNKNYTPANCRWIPRFTGKNRAHLYITINGVTLTMTGWCRLTGTPTTTAHRELRRGKKPKRVFIGRRRNT